MRLEIKTTDDYLKALEHARKIKDITRHKLSKTSGFAHATYWGWAKSGIPPRLETALKYAETLGFRVILEHDE